MNPADPLAPLREVFDRQRAFSERVLREQHRVVLGCLTPEQREHWTKEYVLALHAEASELLREVKWKPYLPPDRAASALRGNVLEEITDIWKYLLNLLLTWGVSPEEFLAKFHEKSAVVELRYQQDAALAQLRREARPVLALDIDGVLTRYPEDWLAWLCREKGRGAVCSDPPVVPFATVEDARDALPPDVYADYKLEYRESGAEARTCTPRPGAAEAVRRLAEVYAVVLISARPVREVNRLYGDTLAWLAEHAVPYTALYFDREKAIKVARALPGLCALVEDNPAQARAVARTGAAVYYVGPPGPDWTGLNVVAYPSLAAAAPRLLADRAHGMGGAS